MVEIEFQNLGSTWLEGQERSERGRPKQYFIGVQGLLKGPKVPESPQERKGSPMGDRFCLCQPYAAACPKQSVEAEGVPSP